jgi:hypothetical protein
LPQIPFLEGDAMLLEQRQELVLKGNAHMMPHLILYVANDAPRFDSLTVKALYPPCHAKARLSGQRSFNHREEFVFTIRMQSASASSAGRRVSR